MDPATMARPLATSRAFEVDLVDLALEAMGPELEAMRPEGVRLDQVGAGREVVLVHRANDRWVRQVQLVEAAVQEDAAAVQHRAHPAVGDEHTLVDLFEERPDGDRVGLVVAH
jgi:hypothetical protein